MPTISGTAGNDVLVGTPAQDLISGLAGDDTIDGAAGDDQLNGGAGSDILRGGDGDDSLSDYDTTGAWSRSVDFMFGGRGRDTYSVNNVAAETPIRSIMSWTR
ncbi:hypothetical protein [Brevundimonas sp.]|jgi:Ca2+-binding RTX toxin-like protein|uniref:hypothetical protein n=1 Tax=Brevundimonas sp. TaxID=1871086 RepID=UPI0037850C2A